jgi:hypothetical protein
LAVFAAPIVVAATRGTYERVLTDLHDTFVSPRQKIRITLAAWYAHKTIQERLENGDEVRNDDFFDPNGLGRSSAEEIFEGTLLVAKDEHEEKKLLFLGNLFAGIAFAPSASRAEANYLISVAERLTYQQYVIISLYGRLAPINTLREKSYEGEKNVSWDTVSILSEMYELYTLGILAESRGYAVLDMNSLVPKDAELGPLGERLNAIMRLQDIPDDDTGAVLNKLK